jgi:thiol:disulfide interchange protein
VRRLRCGAVLATMTPFLLYHGPFGLELGAIGYAAFCALASFLVTCFVASNWPLKRRLSCCLSAWSRVLGGASALYLIRLLDEQNGDVSLAYVLLFVIVGAWLLAHDLRDFGSTSRTASVGVSSAALILATSGFAYMATVLQAHTT